MRLRLACLAFCAVVLAAICGGCKWSGVSAVYMAIDSMGAQERTVFFTDSTSIYCVTKFSSARQDATLSITIHQVPGPMTTMAQGGQMTPLHPTFAVDQETPGPGTETVVAYQIPPNGIEVTEMCFGYCSQNGIGCTTGYQQQGLDSCGIGATCCFNPLVMMAGAPPLILPYPVGNYTCEVDVNGDVAGVAPFEVDFPPMTGNMQCPIAPPVDGVICAGWVMQGAHCQGFNADESCVCDGAGWKCTKT
jgi:hypothetical protein